MMFESRKGLRARIQAVLRSEQQPAANANMCEPGRENGLAEQSPNTIRGDELPLSPLHNPSRLQGESLNMDGIYRVHFAGFNREAYQAMEDTLLLASQAVSERFVPTDPVSMALGARPDVLVINLNHPDATQLGKELRPAPGVPVVWVSISPEGKGVGDTGSPLFTNLVKAMQDVLAQRAVSTGSQPASGG